jgi:hypothetical protein
VWQGSGKQLAKEQLMMNERFPFARLNFDAATGAGTGTAGALLFKTINGLSIPSNSEGIGSNNVAFSDTATGGVTARINFRMFLELWLQLGVDDKYFTTLVDARPLASYVLEVTWASQSEFLIPGATAGGAGVPTYVVNASIQSYDQDNIPLGVAFGTFKRASFQPPGLAFSNNQVQALLPRGNMYYGVILETLGFKAAGLATIPQPGNDIVSQIQNRINSNYQLRDTFWRDLQAKNRDEAILPGTAYDAWGPGVLGWAYLYYPCTGDTVKELVATYTMDQFDLLMSLSAATGAGDGNVYNGNPVVNMLTQEVIPGKSVSASQARGAFAGSAVSTSAKPGT